jgi:hypothetical protein
MINGYVERPLQFDDLNGPFGFLGSKLGRRNFYQQNGTGPVDGGSWEIIL